MLYVGVIGTMTASIAITLMVNKSNCPYYADLRQVALAGSFFALFVSLPIVWKINDDNRFKGYEEYQRIRQQLKENETPENKQREKLEITLAQAMFGDAENYNKMSAVKSQAIERRGESAAPILYCATNNSFNDLCLFVIHSSLEAQRFFTVNDAIRSSMEMAVSTGDSIYVVTSIDIEEHIKNNISNQDLFPETKDRIVFFTAE